jgi:hypothetical protein
MRLKAVASVIPIALATCGGAPSGKDLTIDVFLAQENNKCVVRFTDTGLKDARRAVAWTNHAVTWRVVRNDCGEKTKIDKKALGLKHLKVKSTGAPAAWFDQCSKLDHIPARIQDPVPFGARSLPLRRDAGKAFTSTRSTGIRSSLSIPAWTSRGTADAAPPRPA